MAVDVAEAQSDVARPRRDATTTGPDANERGEPLLTRLITLAGGTDPQALAAQIARSGHRDDPRLWTAIQHELGNGAATQIRVAMNKHVPAEAAAATDSPASAPPAVSSMAATTQPQPTGDAAKPDDGVLTAPREATFYGIRVVAAAGVHADAVDRCAQFITDELGNNVYAQQRMAKARVTIVIIPAKVPMTDLAQFKALKGTKTFDGRDWATVRGAGGMNTPDGNFSISIAEENLTQAKDVVSAYPATYSIGTHEFAHGLELKGVSSAERDKIKALYAAHNARDPGNKKGTWTDTYASSNELEYFAQSTTAFFGRNQMGTNHNGRAWLQENDPDMYQFLVQLYAMKHDAKDRVTP